MSLYTSKGRTSLLLKRQEYVKGANASVAEVATEVGAKKRKRYTSLSQLRLIIIIVRTIVGIIFFVCG